MVKHSSENGAKKALRGVSFRTRKKKNERDNSLIIIRLSRAENGTRTRDLNLGKVALYQLSYFRKIYLPRPGKLRFLRFGTANIK